MRTSSAPGLGSRTSSRYQLAGLWPGAGQGFCAIDSPIALAFLKRYPSPVDARGLAEQRLAGFLHLHRYTARKPARELLTRLRTAAEDAPASSKPKPDERSFRWACDHRPREAINVLADPSRHHNPWAAECQIIWRLWHDHDTYNPTKHTARQRLITAQG